MSAPILPETAVLATKEIDGVIYQLQPMQPDKVVEHGGALLSSVLAAPLARAVTAGDESAIAGAMLAVLQNLSSPALKAAIVDIWPTAFAGGVGLANSWKVHFTGKTGSLVRFLAWALEEQFRDFFVSLTGVLKDAGASMAAKAAAKKQAAQPPSLASAS